MQYFFENFLEFLFSARQQAGKRKSLSAVLGKEMLYDFVISLGTDCYPRFFIDRYSVQNRFPVRMPFDGAYHPIKSVIELLSTNFRDYLSEKFLELVGDGKIRHRGYSIDWCHEKTSDFKSFRKHSLKRIQQFRKIVRGNEILFFIFLKKKDLRVLEKLFKILRKKYSKKRFRIFALSTEREKEIVKETPRYYYCNVPVPFKGYQFWTASETKKGQSFEKKILSHFLKAAFNLTGQYLVDKAFSNRLKQQNTGRYHSILDSSTGFLSFMKPINK